jgi:hypothetical protein
MDDDDDDDFEGFFSAIDKVVDQHRAKQTQVGAA